MFRLFVQEMKFRLNGIIGWGIGLCFFPIVYIGIYPQVAEEMVAFAEIDFYSAMGMSLGTFSDWVASIMLVLLPLVASIYAIINATATLAGEEEDGRLEMLVTMPIPRWQIVSAKALAFTISSAIIFLIVSLCSVGVFEAIKNQIETDLVAMDMFQAVITGWPLVFAIGMLSLFLAAFCSRRRIASIIAAAVLLVSYFGSNLAASTKALEPFEPFFLFTYLDSSGSAITNGQLIADILVLLGIGLVSFVLALVFFQRRKLTVGEWPWQRGRIEA